MDQVHEKQFGVQYSKMESEKFKCKLNNLMIYKMLRWCMELEEAAWCQYTAFDGNIIQILSIWCILFFF